MNYYERHLGDYARDTAHLTMLEHGAYTALLDRYYLIEAPIPAAQAHRVARAKTNEEREAVDTVLAEFFLLEDGAWRHFGADEEIEKARRKESALNDLRERDVYRRFRALVMLRDGESCAYCGVSGVPLQLDHIVPRSRGGSDFPENLTPACKPCNTSKGAKSLAEWGGRA